MAEFVMKRKVAERGLSAQFEIASAATSREEIGNPVYPPTLRTLASHGISCDGKTARRMMVAVFISGIVTGAIGIVLVLLHPQWLLPTQTASVGVSFPAFSLLPKVLLLLAICFVSWCITGLVRKISEGGGIKV